MPYPNKHKARFDAEIGKRLLNPEQHPPSEWIIDLPDVPRQGPLSGVDRLYSLGILYLKTVFDDDRRYPNDPRCQMSGQALNLEKSNLEELNPADFAMVGRLVQSVSQYVSVDAFGEPDCSHLRHIARWWVYTRDDIDFFPQRDDDSEEIPQGVGIDDLCDTLKPLLDEIDSIYQELRGGQPGHFDKTTGAPEYCSAPLLWSRHRESKARKTGDRPPTIALFLHVRAPITRVGNEEGPLEYGYRILPIVTESIAKDLAAVILDYKKYKTKNGRGEEATQDIFTYLEELGVANPNRLQIENVEILSSTILDATQPRTFLGKQFYHSSSYPAFSSGISTFVKAQACSRCDLIAYGPEFLKEPGGFDTAFIKPTLVSGFPFISFVTKTRADIDNSTPKLEDGGVKARGVESSAHSLFDAFYYNYTFQTGVIRRRLSTRVRRAVLDTYLKGLAEAFSAELTESAQSLFQDSDTAQGTYKVSIKPGWLSRVNSRFDRLAQQLPYAKVVLISLDQYKKNDGSDGTFLEIFQSHYFVRLKQNKYYDRKLIINDGIYLKADRIATTLEKAAREKTREWLNQTPEENGKASQ